MYVRSIVTFIDILGFSELVKSRPPEEVDNAISQLRLFASHDMPDPLGATSVAFSDSVVRMRPIDRPGAAFYEMLDLVHALGELVSLGVLIRGGMTLGDVANNDGRTFGPGFNAAYYLESKCAIHPRVVIDPELLRRCTDPPFIITNNRSDEYGYIRKLLRCSEDGLWHIDYLRAFPEEMDYPDEDVIPWIKSHKGLIEGISKAGGDLSLGTKANWLASYHNQYVSTIEEAFLKAKNCEAQELMVDAAGVPSMFQFPSTT